MTNPASLAARQSDAEFAEFEAQWASRDRADAMVPKIVARSWFTAGVQFAESALHAASGQAPAQTNDATAAQIAETLARRLHRSGWVSMIDPIREALLDCALSRAPAQTQEDVLREALEECVGDLACYEGDPKWPAKNATLKRARAALAARTGLPAAPVRPRPPEEQPSLRVEKPSAEPASANASVPSSASGASPDSQPPPKEQEDGTPISDKHRYTEFLNGMTGCMERRYSASGESVAYDVAEGLERDLIAAQASLATAIREKEEAQVELEDTKRSFAEFVDDVHKRCDAPPFEYNGQVVRDVGILKDQRDALREENERLRHALLPFAEVPVTDGAEPYMLVSVTVEMVRDAKAALGR